MIRFAVALVVLGQQRQVRVALRLRAPVVGDVDLAADDRLDALLARPPGRAATAPASEPWSVSADRRHLELGRARRERGDAARPVEDRVLGVDVQVDEVGVSHGRPSVVPAPASSIRAAAPALEVEHVRLVRTHFQRHPVALRRALPRLGAGDEARVLGTVFDAAPSRRRRRRRRAPRRPRRARACPSSASSSDSGRKPSTTAGAAVRAAHGQRRTRCPAERDGAVRAERRRRTGSSRASR